jgi:EpsI family protein
VRYLISSVTLGCLFAYLTFRSTARRLMFVGLSVVVPVIANGLRAYMIVMIGHLSGMKLATGVDHLIYGWLFFGLVMFIMFWIGSYWREDEVPAHPPAAPAAVSFGAPAASGKLVAMAAAVLLTAALWPAFGHYNDRANFNPAPVRLDMPAIRWQPTLAFTDWTPRYIEPDAGLNGAWRTGSMAPVGMTVLYYRNQDSTHALISSVNRLAGHKDAWHPTASSVHVEHVGNRDLAVRETTLQSPQGTLLLWDWLWAGGRYTANSYVGKLLQAQSKLLFQGDDGAALMVYAPVTDKPEAARQAMRAFLSEHLKPIDAALAAAKEH